ncbi:MAG: hypothetical protein WA191_17005 [Telluria sp.]
MKFLPSVSGVHDALHSHYPLTETKKDALMRLLLPRSIRSFFFSALVVLGFTFNPVLSPNANALGGVSRACFSVGANESITVDWWYNNYWMYTFSDHYTYGTFQHTLQDGWTYGWRSRAGHFFEYWASPYVVGYHYNWTPTSGTVFMGYSNAWDCNLANWGG